MFSRDASLRRLYIDAPLEMSLARLLPRMWIGASQVIQRQRPFPYTPPHCRNPTPMRDGSTL
ncbi:MAG: hypothetical protein WBG94_20195 [Anaerolineales bacterium]